MSKFIVFERTGEIRGPRKGEHYETPGGDILMCVEPDRAIGWYRIFRRLPDAEVEALEARLAEAADHVHDLKLMEADRDAWKARAEKAEAERDAVHDTALMRLGMLNSARERADKMEMERDELRAQLADREKKCAMAVRELVRGKDDARARFERETAALLFARFVSVDGDTAKDELSADEAVKCARRFADRFFGPAPAAVKVDAPPAPPQFKVGDPVTNPKGCRGTVAAVYPNETLDLCVRWDGDPHSCYAMSRELRPAPPEPWTPKVGDKVKIIASTFLPNDKTLALIGSVAKVTDVDLSTVLVLGYMFDYSDLELVCRAEDAAS